MPIRSHAAFEQIELEICRRGGSRRQCNKSC